MTSEFSLTIVVGFRERDLRRLQLCLDSLRSQTTKAFQVRCVDYGSTRAFADSAARLVERYDFCQYAYTDARGYPWSRSHCLNIGIRRSDTEYTMTSDMDMFYAPNFVEELLKHSSPEKIIYFHPVWLKKNEFPSNTIDTSRVDRSKAHRGMFETQTAKLHQLSGFDEYFRYWGLEDLDMALRFGKLGLQEHWLNDDNQTYVLHQWHPESGFYGDGIPIEVWQRLYLYYLRKKQTTEPSANSQWGRIIKTEERTAFRFLDFERKALRKNDLRLLQLDPRSHGSIGKFSDIFDQASPGQAIAVDHAWFGAKSTRNSAGITFVNGIAKMMRRKVRWEYARNALHSYLALFVMEASDLIEDYYLNFPAENGISLVVKK